MAYKDPLDERAKESRRKHYRNNREQYYANNKLKTRRMREYIEKVKSVPCLDCGVEYPSYVMDFDHRPGVKKLSNVGRMMTCGSWTKLLAEIDKCDIVCSNCHRERTFGKTPTAEG